MFSRSLSEWIRLAEGSLRQHDAIWMDFTTACRHYLEICTQSLSHLNHNERGVTASRQPLSTHQQKVSRVNRKSCDTWLSWKEEEQREESFLIFSQRQVFKKPVVTLSWVKNNCCYSTRDMISASSVLWSVINKKEQVSKTTTCMFKNIMECVFRKMCFSCWKTAF